MRRLLSLVTATISISITAILANFEAKTINYGQLIKEREKGRVVGKTRMVIFGDVDDAGIDTVYVERYNLTLRHGISRLVRKSLCSKFPSARRCWTTIAKHFDQTFLKFV